MRRGFLSKNNEAALVTEFSKQTVPHAKKIRREKTEFFPNYGSSVCAEGCYAYVYVHTYNT